VQQPVPLWIGGNSTTARRRAARFAQGWMPFGTPANPTVRTPAIETADDLAPLIAELHGFARDEGREVVDVHFGVPGGGLPGTDAFDPAFHRDQIDALAGIGVTAVGT